MKPRLLSASLLIGTSLGLSLPAMANNADAPPECPQDAMQRAQALIDTAAGQADLLQRSLTVMQALRECKTYAWWMQLGDLQARQAYWHEAADAYTRARDILPRDPDGAMSAADLERLSQANQALADAFWRSEQQASALLALEESRLGYEVLAAPLPETLLALQGEIDDAFSQSDASLLAETLTMQRARSVRGIGVRPKLRKPPLESEAATAESTSPSTDGAQAPNDPAQSADSSAPTTSTSAHINLQVLFPSNSAELPDSQLPLIARMASALEKLDLKDSDTIMVIGHTDTRGSDDYNLELSQQRASAVKTHLLEMLNDAGVTHQGLEAVGVGETSPRYPDSNSESHRRNRRVELAIRTAPSG